MQVLGQCKRFLSYGGLSNQPSIHFGCASVPISISRSVVIGSQLLLMLAAALSTVHKYAVSLKAIIFPVYTFLIVAIKLATYIDALSKIDKIDEIFDYLQAVVNKRCGLSAKSRAIYAKRDSIEMRIVSVIIGGASTLVVISYLPSALCWLSTITLGRPSTRYWIMPLGVDGALSINIRTPMRFIITLIVEGFLCEFYILISIEFLIFYVGTCTYLSSCIDDLASIVGQPHGDIHQSISMKAKFVQFIELHLHFYKMIRMLERIISTPLILQIPVFGIQLAIILNQIEHNIAHLSLAVIVIISKMICYAVYNYVLCYYVTAITVDVDSIGDFAYNSPWYQMTRDERRIVEMIVRRTQKPCEIKGLGVFVCSLETYLTLIKSSVSYYMVFRKLNAV